MQQISSSEFKGQLGQFLSNAHAEPIEISRSGKPIAVLLSPHEYEYLQRMEDLYWIARAEAARESGEWVSHIQAVELLAEKLGNTE